MGGDGDSLAMAPCLDLIDNCGLRFCNLLVPCFLGTRSQVRSPGALFLRSWDHVLCLFHNPCPPHALWNTPASPELGDERQLIEISTAVVHPTPTRDLAHEYNQPKDTEPGSGSGSRSIYDVLSQSWHVGALHSGNLLP